MIRIAKDSVSLSTNNPLEKLAISYAMAQSAKLDIFEERVEETIRETKDIPEDLAASGNIQYSQQDISKLIGRLFIEVRAAGADAIADAIAIAEATFFAYS